MKISTIQLNIIHFLAKHSKGLITIETVSPFKDHYGTMLLTFEPDNFFGFGLESSLITAYLLEDGTTIKLHFTVCDSLSGSVSQDLMESGWKKKLADKCKLHLRSLE